ncbi:hypothetical protein [Sorangium sp. So ce1078]|uniref:hypothetical protein n=1 Tax=Sorangium sp. So ce1078 TaxID=3133329 RepID=UPI003F628A4D
MPKSDERGSCDEANRGPALPARGVLVSALGQAVNAALRRHNDGRPLFTLNMSAAELSALREELADGVRSTGIAALRAPGRARMFVAYAAEFLCQEGHALEWRPILGSIGVSAEEAPRYSELYEAVADALRSFDRQVVTRQGRRRFLATLLREGGLPVRIGNLPELVAALGREIGWESLAGQDGMAARRFAVARIKLLAQGRLRELLDASEAAEALEDILADAAATRERLARCGVDPTSLGGADDVRRALDQHGIELPGTRNPRLLAAMLASFRDAAQSPRGALGASLGAALELRAILLPGSRIEVRASLDLAHPALRGRIPADVTYATVALEPGTHGPRLIAWSEGEKRFESDDAVKGHLEWHLGVGSPTAMVVARYAARGGAAHVVPVETLVLPDEALWWFDGEGRMLRADQELIAAGERRLLLAREEVVIETSGGVTAAELSGGAAAAWAIDAAMEGEVCVLTAGGEITVLECRQRVLSVSIEGGFPSQFSRATSAFERLPDLTVNDAPDGVDVVVSAGPHASFETVARDATGRIRLSGLPQFRGECGTVRVRLTARDGRSFCARWTAIPPQIVELVEARRVVFGSKLLAHVTSPHGVVTALGPGRFEVQAPADAQEVAAALGLNSGEILRACVPLARRYVRLWKDVVSREEAPLDGTASLTERMVFTHACVEVRSEPDREVWLEDEGGARLVTSRTDRFGRALVPLRDVVRQKLRPDKSSIVVAARVDGDPAAYRFQVVVPRMHHPSRVARPGQFVLKLLLDERDLPEKPALACFDVLRPFDEPAIVACGLEKVGPQRFEAAAAASALPTSRGRWIVFLADAARSPVRSHSGGVLVEIPLDVEAVPPRALSALDEGLWSKNEPQILRALEDMTADPPAFDVWLDRFVGAVRARAAFGLEWFYLFDLVAARAPWVLLAAAARLPARARFAWLDLYRSECRGFTWLGVTRSERRPLARALRRTEVHEITELIETAKQARAMPRAVELTLYQEALGGRPEAPLLLESMKAEVFGEGGPIELPRDWEGRLALRMSDLTEVATQDSLRGRRAAALLKLRQGASQELLEALPRAWVFGTPGAAPSVTATLIEAEAKAKRELSVGHGRTVVDAELRVAEAAQLLTAYREQGLRIKKDAWNAIAVLDQIVPDLLDAWLLASMGKR